MKMELSNLLPLSEFAARIGRDPATIRQKILRGNLPGAVKIGRDWFVPADIAYNDRRIKSGKYIGSRESSERPE